LCGALLGVPHQQKGRSTIVLRPFTFVRGLGTLWT
jgi:hypothetical protein